MKKRKIVLLLLILLCLGAGGFAAYKIINKDVTDYQNAKDYEQIAEEAFPGANKDGQTPESGAMGTNTPRGQKPNFTSLKATNEHCVGWIQMPDSIVNYPVVWRSYNTEYFLKHIFTGAYGNAGTIYISDECDPHFKSQNTILFGHHMFNGTMFADIAKFRDQTYADAHKEIIYFSDEGKKYVLVPFAGVETNGSDDYLYVNFATQEDFMEYITDKLKRSTFSSKVSLAENDRIVTLSTCTYDVSDGRFALYCKLYEYDMETTSEPVEVKNPDPQITEKGPKESIYGS